MLVTIKILVDLQCFYSKLHNILELQRIRLQSNFIFMHYTLRYKLYTIHLLQYNIMIFYF